jgi:phosphopentomutase
MKPGRFIILVLDSFGIGAMDDVPLVRPQDKGANTFRSVLSAVPDMRFPNLGRLGLANAAGFEAGGLRFSSDAAYGRSDLMHFWCDSYWGHQELMGTRPRMPLEAPFSSMIDAVAHALRAAGHRVDYVGCPLKVLVVDNAMVIGDNIEADLGQNYNVTAAFDAVPFEKVKVVGRIVRNLTGVARVISFGSPGVSLQRILGALETRNGTYVGINAPRSGVYREGYLVAHMGFGVDAGEQLPRVLKDAGYRVVLIGKAADIIDNPGGTSISAVDTETVMRTTVTEIADLDSGFVCSNVQETDLAGHRQDPFLYAEKLRIADSYIGDIIELLEDTDILIVTADHGNDPLIGHPQHTRERVPMLFHLRSRPAGLHDIGTRKTLADMGATAAHYFSCGPLSFGESFLGMLPRGKTR